MKSISRKRLFVSVAVICFMAFAVPTTVLGAAYNPNEDYQDLKTAEKNLKFWNDERPDVGFYINAANRYILETVPNPSFGTSAGEWSVMDLLRGMYTGSDYINHIPDGYFERYLSNVESHVSGNDGNLHDAKSTEWSRSILSLSAMGYDITNVGRAGEKYDYITALSKSHMFSYRQGINGPIWELIAMDTGKYQFYDEMTLRSKGVSVSSNSIKGTYAGDTDLQTRGKVIDYILNREAVGGGWSLMGGAADPDITGMALQALAPYYLDEELYNSVKNTYVDSEGVTRSNSYEDFAAYVERAVAKMAEKQSPNGGYDAWGGASSESIAQVIVALTALNIDPTSESVDLPHINRTVSFKKAGGVADGVYTDNMIDCILRFWAPGIGSSPEVGGFKHVVSGYDGGGGAGTSVNPMATDQAAYALISYDRLRKGEKALYDMTDMTDGQYRTMEADEYTLTFDGRGIMPEREGVYSPYEAVSFETENSNDENNVFINWNTKADGSGTGYDEDDLLCMPEEDITLYAMYADQSEANRQAAARVDRMISEIGTVTAESGPSISVARAKYDALTPAQKDFVTKLGVLEAAEAAYDTLMGPAYDQAAAKAVDDLIAAVNTPITFDSREELENARTAYNTLTNARKALVRNLALLESYEAELKRLDDERAAGELAEVSAGIVVQRIKDLGELKDITTDSKIWIDAAREEYEQLAVDAPGAQEIVKASYLDDERTETAYTRLLRAEIQYKGVCWISDELFSDYGISGEGRAGEGIRLTWKAVKDADGYAVYKWNAKEEVYEIIDRTKELFSLDTDEDLKFGETYSYCVRAYNEIDGIRFEARGTEALPVTVELPSPAGVTANSVLYRTIDISWQPVVDADGYEVYAKRQGKTTYSRVADLPGVNSNRYRHVGLADNETVSYRIKAYKMDGSRKIFSSESDVAFGISGIKLPDTVAVFKAAQAGYNSVSLTWGRAADATGYEIYRSEKGKRETRIAVSAGTKFVDKKKITGRSYSYRIRSYRTYGGQTLYGGFSVVRSARPALKAPAKVKARPAKKSAILSWRKVSGASGYAVYRAAKKKGKYKLVKTLKRGGSVKFTNKKLKKGKRYYYKVRAYRTVKGKKVYSPYSRIVSAKSR